MGIGKNNTDPPSLETTEFSRLTMDNTSKLLIMSKGATEIHQTLDAKKTCSI